MAEPAVRLTTVEAEPTVVVAETTTWDAFPTLWGSLLAEVYAVLPATPANATDALQQRWRNVMLYHDDVPHVEVGVLANGPFARRGRVVSSALPAGKVATTVHSGAYTELGVSHRAVIDWCVTAGHELAGPRWEVYGHWQDDPRDLVTEVYYLLV
jgi:effector-binding domain-containing protein